MAQVPCVMITGDNPLTAANIGYQCKISNKKKKTYILDYEGASAESSASRRGNFVLEHFVYEVDQKKNKVALD